MPSTGQTKKDSLTADPLHAGYFAALIEGTIFSAFTEVSGLGSETEVAEFKEQTKDGRQIVRKVPGNLKWNDITLKRGLTDNMDMWNWRQLVVDGKAAEARKNMTIYLYDTEHKPVAQWNIVKAWPSKISPPSMSTSSNDIAIEELTIVHEGIERVP